MRTNAKAPRSLSYPETVALLEGFQTQACTALWSLMQLRNRCMVMLMLDTGIRVGELVQLKWASLYSFGKPVENLLIHEDIAKGRRSRTIPMSDRLKKIVDEMHTKIWINDILANRGYAFSAIYSYEPLTTRQVQRIVFTYGMLAFGRRCTPHMLRHTFATRLMKVTNIRVVQRLLGHQNLSSTEIYTHPDMDDLQQAIAGIGEK